jgi:hypothetical protein
MALADSPSTATGMQGGGNRQAGNTMTTASAEGHIAANPLLAGSLSVRADRRPRSVNAPLMTSSSMIPGAPHSPPVWLVGTVNYVSPFAPSLSNPVLSTIERLATSGLE